MQVYLGMEQRDPRGEKVGALLVNAFKRSFASIQYTIHPSDIAGEAPGKSSNISWIARKVSSQALSDLLDAEFFLTVMDGKLLV